MAGRFCAASTVRLIPTVCIAQHDDEVMLYAFMKQMRPCGVFSIWWESFSRSDCHRLRPRRACPARRGRMTCVFDGHLARIHGFGRTLSAYGYRDRCDIRSSGRNLFGDEVYSDRSLENKAIPRETIIVRAYGRTAIAILEMRSLRRWFDARGLGAVVGHVNCSHPNNQA